MDHLQSFCWRSFYFHSRTSKSMTFTWIFTRWNFLEHVKIKIKLSKTGSVKKYQTLKKCSILWRHQSGFWYMKGNDFGRTKWPIDPSVIQNYFFLNVYHVWYWIVSFKNIQNWIFKNAQVGWYDYPRQRKIFDSMILLKICEFSHWTWNSKV